MNILRILNKEKTNAKKNPPIWFMRQAGRYLPEYQQTRKQAGGFLELCYSPKLACEVTLQPIKRFALDAAIIFSDILVIPDSMGVDLSFIDNAGPALKPIQNKKELLELRENKHKLPLVYEAISQTRDKLAQDTALIGFAGGAWTIAAYIVEGKISRDLAVVKAKYYNDRSFFKALMDILVENIAEHLINQVKAGADLIQIFDSWAGLLIGDDYQELVIEPTNKIIKKIRAIYPNIAIICFPRASGFQYAKFCQTVDCQAIGVDQYTPLKWMRKNNQQKIIQGNLDPLVLLSDSTDLIKKAADSILATMEGQDFIFNLGHGIVPKTPPANVEFLVKHIRNIQGS